METLVSWDTDKALRDRFGRWRTRQPPHGPSLLFTFLPVADIGKLSYLAMLSVLQGYPTLPPHSHLPAS